MLSRLEISSGSAGSPAGARGVGAGVGAPSWGAPPDGARSAGSALPPERKKTARTRALVLESVAGFIDAMLAEDLAAPRK